MNCEECEELVGVYVLGALEPEEHTRVRDHLATCANHPEAAALRAVAATLAFAGPEAEPPPALKTRLLDAVEAESVPRAGARREGLLDWIQRIRPQVALPYGLAGALALAIFALILINGGGSDEPRALTMTGAGDARATVRQLEGDVLLVEAERLKPLSNEQTYQLWGINERGPYSLGLLGQARGGETLEVMRADLSDLDALAVTVEPARGSAAPTSEPVMKAEDILAR